MMRKMLIVMMMMIVVMMVSGGGGIQSRVGHFTAWTKASDEFHDAFAFDFHLHRIGAVRRLFQLLLIAAVRRSIEKQKEGR